MYSPHEVKVGIFVDGDFIPSYDGASNRFHYLSRYLAKSGIKVVVFHGYRKWSDVSLIKKEPFKTYFFPSKTYYSNLELIASLVKKEGINIIQFDNLEPVLLQGLRLSHMTGAHLVNEMHYVVRNLAKNLGANKKRLKNIAALEHAVGKAVDQVICLSADDKPTLSRNMAIEPGRISVIPSGVDVEAIKFFGPSIKAKNIIFLGNLYFEPNAQAVREIFKRMYPPMHAAGFKFTITGDCPDSLKQECRGPGFTFTGPIKDLNALFHDATFALAPIIEGTGMRIKILNYLAAGIPVITTSTAAQGFPDHSCLFIENDFNAYPDLMIRLLDNETRMFSKAIRGRDRILNNYSWGTIARQTIKTYEKILARPRRAKDLRLGEVCTSHEPVWLEEAIQKKRFRTIPCPALSKPFSYAISNGGKLTTYLLERLIAFEGMPGAGKTTTINSIMRSDHRDVVVLRELDLPLTLSKNKDNLQMSALFLHQEIQKTERIEKLARTHKIIVLDRSFISTLAYGYARSKVQGKYPEFLFFMKEFLHLSSLSCFAWPTHVICFDLSISESIRRRRAFAGMPEYRYWFNPVFLGHFKNYYASALLKVGLTPQRISTDSLTTKQLAAIISRSIHGTT